MKRFKDILFLLPVFALVLISNLGFSQEKKEERKDAIRQAINSRQYVFKAKTALPASGRARQLTSEYDLTVKNDSLFVHLPYFGRAYTAPIGKSGDGISFTSTDFSHEVTENKKGGWRIEIRPKEHNDVRQMYLNISESGNGTLQVVSNNRQAISFTGDLEPLKE
jgi:hypothetical protein